MIPVAAINAAVYGSRHRKTKVDSYDININENRELYKKSNLILEYLEKTFKIEKIEKVEDYSLGTIIYNLKFYSFNIGIQISNEMIVNADIDWLYRYSYDLVFKELMNITKQRYVNLESQV